MHTFMRIWHNVYIISCEEDMSVPVWTHIVSYSMFVIYIMQYYEII